MAWEQLGGSKNKFYALHPHGAAPARLVAPMGLADKSIKRSIIMQYTVLVSVALIALLFSTVGCQNNLRLYYKEKITYGKMRAILKSWQFPS